MIDIPRPNISPDFTIDDIHKIREWNHERRKGMTTDEIMADRARSAKKITDRIETLRKS